MSRGDIVSSELTVKILLKAIKAKNAKKYLVDGFPRNIEQALCYEKNYREIDLIINYQCPDDVLVDRVLKRAAVEHRQDDNEDTVNHRLKIFHEETEPTIEFYARHGKVINIPATGTIDEVYNLTLQALQPNLIFFYGPPACGQDRLAERLASLSAYNLIKIQDYFRSNGLANATDEVKMDHLITFFSTHPQRNFIVHGFPENIRQVKIFVEHFSAPKKFYYFDFTRDQVENHIKNFTKPQRQALLQEYERYVQNRKDILKYFNNKPYFITIHEDESPERLWNSLLETIAPEVIALPALPDDEFSQQYITRIQNERGYVYLDIVALVQDEIKRGTELGKRLSATMQSGHNFDENQVALIKRIFFNDLSKRKFILGGFPNTFAALEFFEQNCCKIRHLIAFTHKPLNLQGKNLYAQYHTNGRLIKINDNHLDQFDSYVQNRCRYGFIVGPELAGRPAIATYLKNRYVTQVIDYNAVNELLKVRLSTEDNQVEEVPFPELVKYFKEEIASRDRSHNILFDGWPFEKEQLTAFLKSVGAPNYVFWLDATDETLGKRYMAENKVDAVEEADQEKINEELAKTKQFIQAFQECIHEGNNIHLFDIKVGVSTQSTLRDINSIVYKKVFAFKNSSRKVTDADLRAFIINSCINNNVTFIDVADLVNQSATTTDENSKKLQAQAIMTQNALQNLAPSIFTPTLVTDLIAKSLQSHPATKYLLLYNYPSAENKPQGDFYPRAIDELYQIENNIGPLKEVISVVDLQEDFVINDPVEEKPVQEEVKQEVKPPKGEGEEEEEVPEPPKDEDEDGESKPKFNPLDYNWTLSDGNPKSLAKIYHRRFNCEHEQIDLDAKDLTPLDNLLRDSIARFDEGENRDKDYYVEVVVNQN